MARENSTMLDTNDPFPPLDLGLVDGRAFVLPQGFGEGYGVLILYRGHW